MPIPLELLAPTDDDWQFFLDVGGWMSSQALHMNEGRFDCSEWSEFLPPLDLHLAVMTHFMGTWENSGSFTNEVQGWDVDRSFVTAALEAFGCHVASSLWPEAMATELAIDQIYSTDVDSLPPELNDRRESINEMANDDVTYKKLSDFIRQHRDEFACWHQES